MVDLPVLDAVLVEACPDAVEVMATVETAARALEPRVAALARGTPAGLRAYDGKSVIFGIRPEDMDDASLVDADHDGAHITANVALIEALGADILVHFPVDTPTVDSGDPDAVEDLSENAMVVGRFDPRSRVRPGEG